VDNGLSLGDYLRGRGVSRRAFLKFCTVMASLLALPPGVLPRMVEAMERSRRKSVIWLSFQECTGCLESLSRSHSSTLEDLVFDFMSLDYQHTLMACAGERAEALRRDVIARNPGRLIAVVDGSIPIKDGGVYSTIAGRTNLDFLKETVAQAAVVIPVGTCAAFGGIPKAEPDPTGALGVQHLMDRGLIARKPLINVPGCPPIPVVISAVLAHYLTLGTLPSLDALHRPRAFYGETVHDRCYRLHFYRRGKFAKSFDDRGARRGWCLYELGCKGPVTHNACASLKWNQGTSFPIQSGHPCLGCSEPDFWDHGGFYRSITAGLTFTPPGGRRRRHGRHPRQA
jgi:hydrogenase small subunit